MNPKRAILILGSLLSSGLGSAFPATQRPPTSLRRESRENVPKIHYGSATGGPVTGGTTKAKPHGGRRKKAAKEAFLRESCAQGNAIARDHSARQKANRETWDAWVSKLSVAELAALRALGEDKYLSDHEGAPASVVRGGNKPDSNAPVHTEGAGTHNGRPLAPRENPVLDSAEPLDSAGLDALSPAQVREVSDTFGRVLRWALEARGIVALGNRSAAVVACCRPDLATSVGGLEIDRQLARALLATFRAPGAPTEDILALLARAGAAFGRVFHWMLQGQSISANGERLLAVAYTLFPVLIEGKTLAGIGSEAAKTRQATNKIVLDFRDKFPGVIALCQRPDATRLRCQVAQTKAA